MGYIKKHLCLLVLLTGFGCVGPNASLSSADIRKQHVELYIEKSKTSIDLDNDDIAAILKEFVVNITTNEPVSWADIQLREDKYILNISTNVISINYPIRPSDDEIFISDSFLDKTIEYFRVKNPSWYSDMGDVLSVSASRFIVEINDFEWENNKER